MCHVDKLTAEQLMVFKGLTRQDQKRFEKLSDGMPSLSERVQPAFERFLKAMPEKEALVG